MVTRHQPGLNFLTEERLRFETLLADISARFVNLHPTKVDDEIGNAQRLVCESLGANHGSVWQLPETGEPADLLLTHLYRDPQLPPLPELVNGKDYFPWVLGKVLANEIVCFRSIAEIPPEGARDTLTLQQFGIKSGLALPLSVGGCPSMGALSFESAREERDWPESLKKRLLMLAQIFANAIARKRADQKLTESEQRLNLAANAAGAGLWTLEISTGRFWMAPTAATLLGLQPGEQLDFKKFIDLIHPNDSSAVQKCVLEGMLTGDEESVEYRITKPNGTVRWLASRGRIHAHTPNSPAVFMGVTSDITEQKLGEEEHLHFRRRLMDAQEAERCRIARELHDDVGQSLSVLNLQIGNASDRLSVALGNSIPEFSQLSASIVEISKKVSQISRQLHSNEVDILGLAKAVKLICRRFTDRYGILVDLVINQIPGEIDHNTALCFFRITQEAIHNISKHSGASHVKLGLTGSGDELALSIIDDGCGFNVASTRESPGLGLISMRERIELIGGEFEITSKPGAGTSIRVHGPVTTPSRDRLAAD